MSAETKSLKVAVIGGGPSGLVTLKTLLELGDRFPSDVTVDVSLFEVEEAVGGTFRYRSYDNAQLVSSKQLTAFSDFRLPLKDPDHLTLEAYVRYLEKYVEKFRLRTRARRFLLGTRVVNVRRSKPIEGTSLYNPRCHQVTWQLPDGTNESDTFSHLAICSGLHVTPSWPEIPGLPFPRKSPLTNKDNVREEERKYDKHIQNDSHLSSAQRNISVLHSSQYKKPDIYTGKRVLILGTGETGMDMAYEAVKAGASEIVLCTREGFLSFPAVLENFRVLGATFDRPTPIDGLITNLFETAYVHPWVARSHLRWFVSDAIIKKVLWLLTGTEAGCNQWVGELPPHRLGRAYTFLNKSAKAMPYINRRWKRRNWVVEKVARYLDPPTVRDDEPGVDLAPFPSHVLPDGQVIFRMNKRKEALYWENRGPFYPEVCIYATGYTQELAFIDESNGLYPSPSDAECRDIFSYDDPTVSFIGFTRPGVGAIPPQAEMSAQLWSLVIADKLDAPTEKGHYHLLSRPQARIQYGVDYSSYVSQLARDMGSAPSLMQLWTEYGWQVLFIYCFSAAFPTHYRLVGPWRDPDAHHIVRTEILETITRRGIGGNLMMGVIPMVFYAFVNLLAFVLHGTLGFFDRLAPKTTSKLTNSFRM